MPGFSGNKWLAGGWWSGGTPAPEEGVVENLIREWVKRGSGLDNAHVIWKHQDTNSPGGSYVAIELGDQVALGSTDAVLETTDLSRPNGEEVELAVLGQREMVVSVEVFTPGKTRKESAARAIANRIQTSLSLSSVRDLLAQRGLSAFDRGTVRYVPGIRGADFEGRAVLEVRLYVPHRLVERVGYIGSVELTNLSTGQAFTVS